MCREAVIAAALASRRTLLVSLAKGLLSAISYCHQRGVAHCGIGAGAWRREGVTCVSEWAQKERACLNGGSAARGGAAASRLAMSPTFTPSHPLNPPLFLPPPLPLHPTLSPPLLHPTLSPPPSLPLMPPTGCVVVNTWADKEEHCPGVHFSPLKHTPSPLNPSP
jgi:hypothetical protein